MKRSYIKSRLLIMTAFILLTVASCLKVEDTPPADPDPRLINHYCNDPRAVNYNNGFPGIPDSAVCIYPVDEFSGQWQLTDSIFYPDSLFNTVNIKTLTFATTEDSTLTHMRVQGFCNNHPLFITADKYGHATIDTLNNYKYGQPFCMTTDTVTGKIYFSYTSKDTMILELNIQGSNAGFHKGIAWKL